MCLDQTFYLGTTYFFNSSTDAPDIFWSFDKSLEMSCSGPTSATPFGFMHTFIMHSLYIKKNSLHARSGSDVSSVKSKKMLKSVSINCKNHFFFLVYLNPLPFFLSSLDPFRPVVPVAPRGLSRLFRRANQLDLKNVKPHTKIYKNKKTQAYRQ